MGTQEMPFMLEIRAIRVQGGDCIIVVERESQGDALEKEYFTIMVAGLLVEGEDNLAWSVVVFLGEGGELDEKRRIGGVLLRFDISDEEISQVVEIIQEAIEEGYSPRAISLAMPVFCSSEKRGEITDMDEVNGGTLLSKLNPFLLEADMAIRFSDN